MSGPLRKNAPQGAAAEIRTLAATGFSKLGIASHFGTSVRVLDRWIEEDDEIKDAFSFGREDERQSLHNMLYRRAMEKGDTVAALFLLKSRHGYREGDQSEQGNKVSITFNLPGAMSADEYKTLEGIVVPKPKRVSDGD